MYFGSTALKYWYPDFKREPKDIDIMADDGVMTESEQHYWVPTFKEIIELSSNKEYLDPDLLLTIKASHANWNIHWDKTMVDIMFLKEKGHEINVPIYKKLIKDWTKVHGKMSAPLKGKTSKTFFEDAVPRKYIHDDIHKVIAFYDEPLYSRILKGDGTVVCLEYKFNELSFEDKVKLIKEEVYVTALERWIIPNDFDYSAGKAYMQSLRKFITTMSAGWISLWMIDNFKHINRNTFDYVSKFKENEHKCQLV